MSGLESSRWTLQAGAQGLFGPAVGEGSEALWGTHGVHCRVVGRDTGLVRSGRLVFHLYSGTALRLMSQGDHHHYPHRGRNAGDPAGRRDTVEDYFHNLDLGMAVSFHSSTSQLK